MNNLKIKYKLIIYTASVFAILLGIVLISIYLLSENDRKQEFYQRLKDRTGTTLKLLIEVKGMDAGLLQTMDRNTINNLYDEKILIFNDNNELIYSSVDDTKIPYSADIFNQLIYEKKDIETTEDKYEVVGVAIIHQGKYYYGIAKAYDKFGKRQIAYLQLVLIITYFISLALIIILAFFLSDRITSPIESLTKQVESISIDDLSKKINLPANKDEIGILVQKFNELLDRLQLQFSYQKNFVSQISHELKTPLAIMLTNAERSLAEDDPKQWRQSLDFQRSTTMELAHIINALIDLSKVEISKNENLSAPIRIDELIFECIDEIGYLNPAVNFTCTVDAEITDETQLTVSGNKRMLKLAFLNLLKNAINYSADQKANVEIFHIGNCIQIRIENNGKTLDSDDRSSLFSNIFRGKNAQATKGLGLGLFLTRRIIEIHDGEIYYKVSESDTNLFMLKFPDINN